MLTIHVRRVMLVLLAFIFIVSATITILYIQGWRFDFQKFSVDKVGAIYIRSYPQDAAIVINGASAQNESWFFSRGTFISNLFPKNYHIALTEPGYVPWHETVAVSPSLVTEVSHAVLVKAEVSPLAFSEASGSVAHFWLAGASPLALTDDDHLIWNTQKISGTVPVGTGEDNTYLVSFDAAHQKYFVHNATNGTNINLDTLLGKFGVNPKDIHRVAQHRRKIIITTATRISLWDIAKLEAGDQDAEDISIPAGKIAGTAHATFDPDTAHVAVSQFWIAWSMRSGTSSVIAIYDQFLGKLVGTYPTVADPNQEIYWNARGILSILQMNGNLFTFDPSSGTLIQIASDVVSFSWDAMGQNVAALEHSALEVFLTGGTDNYYRFRLPDMSAFANATWYKDGAHLFLIGGNSVAFLDLKDSGLENLAVIHDAHDAQYDPTVNTLYFLRDGRIMAMPFPSD